MLLQDMHDKYWSSDHDHEIRANSGSIKLYGHQRKAQEQIVSISIYTKIELPWINFIVIIYTMYPTVEAEKYCTPVKQFS